MSEQNSSEPGTQTTTEITTTATTTSVMVDGKNGKMPWGAGKVWWLAALPLMGGLTAVSTPWAVNHIENALETDARRDLGAAGIDTSELDIDFDYRDGEAVGELPAGVTAGAAAAAVDDGLLRDFDVTATEAEVPATTEPAEVTAPTDPPTTEAVELGSTDVVVTLSEGAVTLVGTVLSEAQRTQLVDQATDLVGVDNVEDQLVVDALDAAVDGADERIAALGGVLAAAGVDDTVTATLSDTALDVTMRTGDADRAAAMETVVDDAGVDGSAQVTVDAPVGSIDAQVAAFAGEIVLSGTVLSSEQRDVLVAAAVDAVGEENVDDQLVISGLDAAVDGADDRIGDLAGLIPSMLDTDVATAMLTGETLTVTASGSAESGEALEASADATGQVETTVDFTEADDVNTEAEALQAELDALAAEIRENVVFDTSSTALTSTAAGTLDKVVAAMERYRLPVVDVSGHTDSRGDAEANQVLSQGRAESVVAYLIEQGIPAERVRARGAGEAEPIATNDTPAGQAENRRVEFAALASFD